MADSKPDAETKVKTSKSSHSKSKQDTWEKEARALNRIMIENAGRTAAKVNARAVFIFAECFVPIINTPTFFCVYQKICTHFLKLLETLPVIQHWNNIQKLLKLFLYYNYFSSYKNLLSSPGKLAQYINTL